LEGWPKKPTTGWDRNYVRLPFSGVDPTFDLINGFASAARNPAEVTGKNRAMGCCRLPGEQHRRDEDAQTAFISASYSQPCLKKQIPWGNLYAHAICWCAQGGTG
jgi:hypothetical protein